MGMVTELKLDKPMKGGGRATSKLILSPERPSKAEATALGHQSQKDLVKTPLKELPEPAV